MIHHTSAAGKYTQGTHQCCQIGHFVAKFKSQSGHLKPSAATVRCGQRPQHFWSHKEAIIGRRAPQFVVAKGHNIWKITGPRISANPGHSWNCLSSPLWFGGPQMKCQLPKLGILSPRVSSFVSGSYLLRELDFITYTRILLDTFGDFYKTTTPESSNLKILAL